MSRFRWSKEVPALLALGVFLLLGLSLVSFDIADYPEWHTPANESLGNLCGPVGAWVSLRLFHWLGYGSYAALVFVAAWSIRMLRREPVQAPWLRAGGTVLLLVMACAALDIIPGPHESVEMPGFGGILGVSLGHLLVAYFGAAGRVLVIGTLLVLSALLATDAMFADLFLYVRRKAAERKAKKEAKAAATEGADEGHRTGTESRTAAAEDRSRAKRPGGRPAVVESTAPAGRQRSGPEERPTRRLFGLLKGRERASGVPVVPPSEVTSPPEPIAGRRKAPVVDGERVEDPGARDPQKVESDPKEFAKALEKVQKRTRSVGAQGRDPDAEDRDAGLDPLDAENCRVVPGIPQARPSTSLNPRAEGEAGSGGAVIEDETVEPVLLISRDGVPVDGAGGELDDEVSDLAAPSDTEPPEELAYNTTTTLRGVAQSPGGEGPDRSSAECEQALAERAQALSEDHIETDVKRKGSPRGVTVSPETKVAASSGVGSEDDESPPRDAAGTDDEREDPHEAAGEDDVPEDSDAELEDRIESLRSPALPERLGPRKIPRPPRGKYAVPTEDLLDPGSVPRGRELESRQKVRQLETALENFKTGAEVVDIQRGPSVTMFEIALAPGVKVNKIVSLSDDLAIAMRAESVRIVAPIPGKSTVGIEIPNDVKERVSLRELICSPEFENGDYIIPVFIGKDVAGSPVIADLTSMPHLLIAGATGSGKSVCINSIIASILMTQTPDDVRLVLIDPKMVELSGFEDVPHLLSPVVTDMKKAPGVLEWAVKKMDERYDILATLGVRHIKQFNDLGEEKIRKRLINRGAETAEMPFHLPYIVVVVDEYADLMMLASKELEKSITRLAQKSRAVGIHVLLATQRPSVDVITGLIKANMTVRIAFKVSSKVDSRTILDRNGAEKLVGQGDMLFLPPGRSELLRCQGTFLSDDELTGIVNYIKAQDMPDFEPELEDMQGLGDEDGEDFAQRDRLYEQAVRIVLQSGRGSVSLLQRKLEIGYTRAARLMDFMAKEGVVGGYKGSKAREVLLTLEEWEEQRRLTASSN